MRIAVFTVFCFVLNSAIAQGSSSSHTLPISAFNCENLTSQVQTLKESTRSKKEKFSCILNILKSALTDALETSQCEETKDMNSFGNELEEKISDGIIQVVPEMETDRENTNGADGDDKLEAKATQDKTKILKNSTQNIELPTMIPIFKPRQVIRNDFGNNNSARHTSIPVASEVVHTNSNPITYAPKFTIPCQRAADVLDMSAALPREVTENKHVKVVQPKLKTKPQVPSSLLANQMPTTVSVNSDDSAESVAILFKPRAISLTQLYGNLLKKITITVLVPYHMSKMGQQ